MVRRGDRIGDEAAKALCPGVSPAALHQGQSRPGHHRIRRVSVLQGRGAAPGRASAGGRDVPEVLSPDSVGLGASLTDELRAGWTGHG